MQISKSTDHFGSEILYCKVLGNEWLSSMQQGEEKHYDPIVTMLEHKNTQKYLSNNYCLAGCQIVPVQMQTCTQLVLCKMGAIVYLYIHFNQQKLQPSKCYG